MTTLVTCTTCLEEHAVGDLSHRCPSYEELSADRARVAKDLIIERRKRESAERKLENLPRLAEERERRALRKLLYARRQIGELMGTLRPINVQQTKHGPRPDGYSCPMISWSKVNDWQRVLLEDWPFDVDDGAMPLITNVARGAASPPTPDEIATMFERWACEGAKYGTQEGHDALVAIICEARVTGRQSASVHPGSALPKIDIHADGDWQVGVGHGGFYRAIGPSRSTPEEARACANGELERLRNVIRVGGAMYRAERAAMGIPGGIDLDDALGRRTSEEQESFLDALRTGLGENARSALEAVRDNTCFVSVSGTLMNLRDMGLIESCDPSEAHRCGWRVTAAGLHALSPAPEVRTAAAPADDHHHSCRWGLGPNVFDLECKACETEVRGRLRRNEGTPTSWTSNDHQAQEWLAKNIGRGEAMSTRVVGSLSALLRSAREDAVATVAGDEPRRPYAHPGVSPELFAAVVHNAGGEASSEQSAIPGAQTTQSTEASSSRSARGSASPSRSTSTAAVSARAADNACEAFDVEAFERDRGFWLSKPSRLRDDVLAMLAEIRRLRGGVSPTPSVDRGALSPTKTSAATRRLVRAELHGAAFGFVNDDDREDESGHDRFMSVLRILEDAWDSGWEAAQRKRVGGSNDADI